MGACRENASLWQYIKYNKSLPSYRWYKAHKDYFWKDSFWQYYYKWIGCKLFGHKNKRAIPYYNDIDNDVVYCCNCRKVVEDILKRELLIEKYKKPDFKIRYSFFELEIEDGQHIFKEINAPNHNQEPLPIRREETVIGTIEYTSNWNREVIQEWARNIQR